MAKFQWQLKNEISALTFIHSCTRAELDELERLVKSPEFAMIKTKRRKFERMQHHAAEV